MPTYVIEFVGLEFYKEAFETPDFVTALLAGLQQLVLEVPAVIIFSLFIAVVLNQKMVGRAAFRAIFFVPVIIATGFMETINASDAMQNMMSGGIDDGSGSSASDIVSAMDIEKMFAELGFGAEIVSSVVGLVNNIYNIINYSGVQMLIFLAGLQSISPAIYESCSIDGATAWETFWKITLPMISPMILVNTIYTIIDSFTSSKNTVMSYISSQSGQVNGQVVGTAMSWIYFLIVAVILAAIAGLLSAFVFYQKKN